MRFGDFKYRGRWGKDSVIPKLDNKTKLRILGLNSAKLYGIKINEKQDPNHDRLSRMREDYQVFEREEGPARSNLVYGWIRTKA